MNAAERIFEQTRKPLWFDLLWYVAENNIHLRDPNQITTRGKNPREYAQIQLWRDEL